MNTPGEVPIFRCVCPAAHWPLLGIPFFLPGHTDPGDLPPHQRTNLLLVMCRMVSGLLLSISTARMRFRHLWHDRYR